MFVVIWPGQTVFGPFDTNSEAAEWCRSKWGNDYAQFVQVWFVEEPAVRCERCDCGR